jgi:hydrogenase nickel incorporation protein HypA/HybF
MHEMSLAQSILEIVDDTLSEENHNELKEVVVDIGELVAVVPESLQFCYSTLIEQTAYRGSKLTINILPIEAKCKTCHRQVKVDKFYFICPQCQSQELEVIQGQELNVRYLEVD